MQAKPKRTEKTAKEKVIAEATKTNTDDLATLTYQIPKGIHQAFKAKTAANGDKMKDIIVGMINDYLKK